MITKKNIVDQILSGGKLTLDEAVAKAMAVKEIKNKDAVRAWKNTFAQNGVITRDATGTYVSAKVVAPKVVEAPVVVAPTPVSAPESVAVVVAPVVAVETVPAAAVVATPAPKTE